MQARTHFVTPRPGFTNLTLTFHEPYKQRHTQIIRDSQVLVRIICPLKFVLDCKPGEDIGHRPSDIRHILKGKNTRRTPGSSLCTLSVLVVKQFPFTRFQYAKKQLLRSAEGESLTYLSIYKTSITGTSHVHYNYNIGTANHPPPRTPRPSASETYYIFIIT